MFGYHEYDLLGPFVFNCAGDPELIQALFDGYGIPAAEQNKNLRRRLFVLLLLHRYSDLRAQINIPDCFTRVKSLAELEEILWPLPTP